MWRGRRGVVRGAIREIKGNLLLSEALLYVPDGLTIAWSFMADEWKKGKVT